MDIDLFLVSRKVEETLLRREIGPCLAWCYENKSKLRKLKVCSVSMHKQVSNKLLYCADDDSVNLYRP